MLRRPYRRVNGLYDGRRWRYRLLGLARTERPGRARVLAVEDDDALAMVRGHPLRRFGRFGSKAV